jgi:hypothetical protein
MAFSPDLLTGILAFIMTLLIFSYWLGDTPLFRSAIYLFIGVSAGYVAAVIWREVMLLRLIKPILIGTPSERLFALIPFVLGLLLLTKMLPPLSKIGTPSMAFLTGVAAAVAIGGAVLGTIFPQTRSAIDAFDLRNAAASSAGEQLFTGLTLLIGTVTTLAYFQFTAKQHGKQGSRRSRIVESMAFLGRIFIAVTFGVIFAGVYASALTALIERLSFIWQFIFSL